MKHVHTLSLITAAVLGAALAAPALAQSSDSYFYGGIGAGKSRARVADDRIAARLLDSELTATATSHVERHMAYKAFGGYQFNPYLGMELGYFRLGRHRFSATTVPDGTLNGRYRVQGANLDAVGTLPLTERFSGFVRAGLQYARTRATITTTGAAAVADATPKDNETNAHYGAGLQFALSPAFLLRAEVERSRISDAVGNHPKVLIYSASAVFRFGRKESNSRRASSAYVAPVALAPAAQAPAPQVVVAPLPPAVPLEAFAPPQSRRVSYSAESFFAFDRAELQPEGMAALDSFAGELAGTRYDQVTVQGYADRIGSTEYNQALSLARAEAVKSYLVSAGKLDGAKIATTGRSESNPVTLPEACKGAPSASVIACLQPDRRVEIEVTGSR